MPRSLTPDDDNESSELPEEDALLTRLSPAMIQAAELMPVRVAADLVRSYYVVQENRLRLDNQVRAARADGLDVTTALHVREALAAGEERAKKLLDRWTRSQPLAIWARSVLGIGPVLAAGLLAEIDVTKAPHASSLWRFAGYDPTAKWEKGQKRPHNADLKVLCYKIGDSFRKVSGKEASVYGQLYRQEKDRLEELNDNEGFADYARDFLAAGERVPRPGTEPRKALEAGRMPQGQVDARSRRKAVKIFLVHYWQAARILAGLPIEGPYVIEKLGHTHEIAPEVPLPTAG